MARRFFCVLAGLLCVALALLSAPQPAHADDYVFVTQWGMFGVGDGAFQGPYGVAVDGSGHVYVVDYRNNRIQKFTSTGTYVTQWGTRGGGNGQFESPVGVAVDASGYVYVAELGNARIQKFTSTGTYVTQWGVLAYIMGIAVDASGYVYVTDATNDRVLKFTSSGTYVTEWGTSGSENGQFLIPWGVAVDGNGNVYVADLGNYNIQKFTSTGTYVTQWGTGGSGNGQFQGPLAVAVDGSGNVYVTESASNGRVQKFTGDGTYITQGWWWILGVESWRFSGAYGVAVDASGYVYVTDHFGCSVTKFGPANPVSVPGEGPLAFALDPVRPNPARGGTLAVQFTLPRAAAASIELLDVAGRRVSAREVGQLGAGRHAVDFSTGSLAPGIYVVRLQQGADVKVVRAAVLGVR